MKRRTDTRVPADANFSMNYHTPVLLEEVLRQLQPRSGGLYVDATLGGGGDAEAILHASEPDGRVIGLDRDDEAIATCRARLNRFGARVQLVTANFSELRDVLARLQVTGVDGVIFDLGVSARQLEAPLRGFSFLHDGPLDMRMSQQASLTAREVLATETQEELARIFFEKGEERRSRAIAKRIVEQRKREPLETTGQLARLVESVLGPKRGKVHPATRVFMALRIHVNRELQSLREGLVAATEALNPAGRLVVISFHSLEDRIVKWFFRETQSLRVLTKKPLMAGEKERVANAKARSAKLRAAEKI
jgi:16S rRNA (cytosine1402-N4)-methyltransferase